MKNIMKEAHKLTKEIKREYPNIDYVDAEGHWDGKEKK